MVKQHGHRLLTLALLHMLWSLAQRNMPADADKQVLALLEAARSEVRAALVADGQWGAASASNLGESGLGLIIYNAVLNTLSTLG